MSEYFINKKINSKQKEFLHNVLDLGLDFLSGDLRKQKVLNYKDIEQLKEKYSYPIPQDSIDLKTLYTELLYLSQNSIAQSDHKYLAFPDSSGSLATYAADIISSFLNQNLIAVDRSAPVSTFIEAQLITWLRHLIGFSDKTFDNTRTLSDLGGMWTTGGNMSNHIAILTALITKFPQILKDGLCKLEKRPVIILSKGIAHYSFLSAAKVLGLGSEGILWTDTNDDFTTNIDSLQNTLKNLPSNVEPFMIVAVAGNCRTSSIDDILKISNVCKKNNIWFHVDACHGGSLLFSDKLRKQLNGIEQADSVTIDPHKSLFVTYSSSYVLFKNPNVMNIYCRYQEQVNNTKIFDIGLITPFYGSRGFESLKLWLLIKHLGQKKIGEYVEQRNELYNIILNKIVETDLFVFFNSPKLYRSVFVFFPKSVRKYCEENKIAQKTIVDLIEKYTIIFSDILYQRGNVILDLFKLNDFSDKLGFGKQKSYPVIGMSIGHVEMDSSEMNIILNEIIDVGNKVLSSMINELFNKERQVEKPDTLMGPAAW